MYNSMQFIEVYIVTGFENYTWVSYMQSVTAHILLVCARLNLYYEKKLSHPKQILKTLQF